MKIGLRVILLALTNVLLLALPTLACNCISGGSAKTFQVYLVITGILSLTPLAILGSVGFWMYVQGQKRLQTPA